LFAQIMFFGALLSAIKSCASATLLAPSVTFSENLLRPILKAWKPHLTDKEFLRWMQAVVLVFTAVVTGFAMSSTKSIYDLVGSAYKVTLVAAFVPLLLGIYWKRATTQGAIASMLLGLIAWISLEMIAGYSEPPAWLGVWLPQFVGVLVSLVSFVLFSLLPQWLRTPPIPTPESIRQAALDEQHHAAAHHAAAHTQHNPH
jgi:Na+/proline symporter